VKTENIIIVVML